MDGSSLIVFLFLLIIYAATSLYCILRLIKLRKFSSQWRHSQIFYVTVALQAVIRSICFGLICLNIGTQTIQIFFLLSVPDTLFIISYLLLFWQMLSLYYYSHQKKNFTMTFLSKVSKRPEQTWQARSILIFMLIWSVIQAMLYILLFARVIDERIISIQTGVVNMLIPLVVLVCIILLEVSFSGVPKKSRIWKHRLNRIKKVTITWSVTRMIRGVINFLDHFSDAGLSTSINDTSIQLVQTLFLIGILLLSEILCICLVADYGFMGIFIFSQDDNDFPIKKKQSLLSEEETQEQTKSENPRSTMIMSSPYYSSTDLQIKDIISATKSKLGVLHTAIFQSKLVTYRKIAFARTSKYVVQEIQQEIQVYKRISGNRLVPIYGIVMEIPTIGIIQKYYASSLYKLIHIDQTPLLQKKKLWISFQIAKALRGIHQQNKCHGHLTSHNILLDQENRPFISGLGFTKVKKYAGIMFGYTYKSGWSSPEILKEKRLTPVKAMETDDIFSFGMIVWEIFSGQIPFAGYSNSELTQKIVTESLRPQIPSTMHSDLERLVVSCWNSQPQTRPSMSLIAITLEQILS